MADEHEPVVLELAALPREQIGPFLLLGLDKDAGPKQIEANWAQRVIWARKNQIRTALGDINWAREVITDPERRVRADLASLNIDTAEGILQGLAEQYAAGTEGISWQALDEEKPLEDFVPSADIPDLAEVQGSIAVPELPQNIPAVLPLLRTFVQEPLDPWSLTLDATSPQDRPHE
jgi:hypothetical protein